MQVKIFDLAASYLELKKEIDTALEIVMKKGWFVLGENVKAFEKEFADFCGVKYCLGVGSGFDALALMLKAYDIKKGDEVIVPADTYIATILAVSKAGATPVFVEPDLQSYNIDPEKIEAVITKKTKAVMAVHLYGQPADITRIKPICQRHNIKLFEDAAQAHGAEHNHVKAGALGDAAAFSFHPTKNLGAFGDAGAVMTNDMNAAEYVRMIRSYGAKDKYKYNIKGVNSRLDELQAAVLRIKLKYLNRWNKRRSEIAKYYLKNLNPKRKDGFTLPSITPGNTHVWHLFVVRSSRRDQLMKYLKDNNIECLVHYPVPPYKQEAYKEMAYLSERFKATNQMADEILSLPIGPHMDNNQAAYVCDTINKFLET